MPKDIVVQKLTDEAFRPFGRIIEGVFPSAAANLEMMIADNAGQRISLPKTCCIDLDGFDSAIFLEIVEPRRDLRLVKVEAHLRGEEIAWCENCSCIALVGPTLTDWKTPLESFFDSMVAFYLPERVRIALKPKVLHYVPIVRANAGLLRFIKPTEIEFSGTFTRKKEIPVELQPRVIVPSEFGIW